MRVNVIVLAMLLVLFVVGAALMLSLMPVEPTRTAVTAAGETRATPALRLGIVPEREIFSQRRRYRALGDYLARAIGRPIELRTAVSYGQVLDDFAEDRIDGAFLGSLTAHHAITRSGAGVLARPETPGGVTTYRGVLFVRANAGIGATSDLAGGTIAVVGMTTAGELFARFVLDPLLAAESPPILRYEGTHDAVIHEVDQGRVLAGATKDLRLDAFEAAHPDTRFRRLAMGPPVPSNALVVTADLDDETARTLERTLLAMHESADGRAVLEAFGAHRFVPCAPDEYAPVGQMLQDATSLRDH